MMKKMNFKVLVVVGLVGLFSACNQDAELIPDLDTASLALDSEIESDFDDVDNFVAEGVEGLVYNSNSGARTNGQWRRHLPDCAEVTHDFEAMTITIDFGEGCEGKGGKVFSGVIFITYTDRKFIPGSIVTTTFENFMVDGKLIEGTRVSENISASLEDNPTFHITLTGGKITLEDGTFATKEADKIKVWIRALNPLNDEYHILDGSVTNGVSFDGLDYNTLIVETLVYKNICKLEGVHIPVAGVKEVTKGDMFYSIYFGDGECDNLVEVTSNGETRTVELNRRRRMNG